MLKKPLRSFAIATVLTLPIVSLLAQKSPAQSRVDVDQVLLIHQLQKLDLSRCSGSNFVFIIVQTDTGLRNYCALPNANFPAGNYKANLEDMSINPIGRSSANVQPSQGMMVPSNQGMMMQPNQGMMMQPNQGMMMQPNQGMMMQPNQGMMMQPNQGMMVQPPPVQLPAVYVSYNPNQPVPPAVTPRINAAFASQGLQPASCSASPVAVFTVNGQYTACAYPSASYPTGNYRLDIPGL